MQLLFLLPLFVFSLALCSPSDVLYIKKLSADEAQLLDVKDFAGLVNIFTTNVTYNPGGGPNVYGIDSVRALFATVFPQGVISQNTISTETITLSPPFDEQGAAGTATGVVYTTTTYVGQGDLAGQALVFFAKYVDKYTKTGNFASHGGWRISERIFVGFGEPVGNRDLLPPSLRG
ncbi:hypothetical protein MMC22_011082 [Lobaria immixta]|nr:hypothetical protein [Lobaria immixta]